MSESQEKPLKEHETKEEPEIKHAKIAETIKEKPIETKEQNENQIKIETNENINILSEEKKRRK